MSEIAHFEESMSRTEISNEIRTEGKTSTAISQLTKRAASLRDHAGMLNNDTARLHENSLRLLLDSETDYKLRSGLHDLLAELTEDHGLGWSEIARLLKVSVPAIRKWRNGGEISRPRLRDLAQLAAFLKLLQGQHIADPAAWLMTPLSSDVDRAVTKAAIYSDGRPIDLLAYVENHISLEQLLDLAGVEAERRSLSSTLVTGYDGSISIVPIGS